MYKKKNKSGNLKVLYIEDVSEIAGGPNSLLQLMSNLKRYTPYLVCPRGPLYEKAIAIGIPTKERKYFYRYESIVLFGKIKIRFNPLNIIIRFIEAIWLLIYIKKNNIKIIHSNDLDGHIATWFLSNVFFQKTIWHIRIMTWPKILYKIPWPSKIIFVSNSVKEYSIGIKYRINAQVVYNGLDVNKFIKELNVCRSEFLKQLGLDPNKKIIGTVGRIKHQKRQKELIKIAKGLVNKGYNIYCLIVGDQEANRSYDSYQSEMLDLIQEYELEKNIIMLGHRQDIANIVNCFDVFVFPAFNDSNPRVILEAMALKKAIVANTTGGVKDMLSPESCILVSPDNTDEYVKAIEKLLEDPTYCADLGINAYNRLIENFTIEKHVQAIENIYEGLLN